MKKIRAWFNVAALIALLAGCIDVVMSDYETVYKLAAIALIIALTANTIKMKVKP